MRAWITLVALSLSTFLYVTTETLPIGLMPQIADGLDVRASRIGLLVTVYGLVVVVTTIPLTRLTHRWPRRRLVGVLLLAFTAATALSALAPNYPTLLGSRIAVALGQAVFWAVVTPAVAALFRPALRGRAVSILYAGSSVAPLLGVPAGTWLGQQAGWRVPFLVLAALGLATLAVIVTLMPALPAGGGDADHGSAPDVGRYRVVVVTTALTVAGAFTAFTYINPFLIEVSGIGEAAIGPILLVRGLAGLLGAVAAGFAVGRHAWCSMVVLAGGQALALAAQYTWGGSQAATVVAISAAGLVLSGLMTVLGTRVLEVAPGQTDLASAGISTAFNVGITAGALIGSVLLASAGVRSVALVGALLTAVAFAAALAEPRLATGRPTERAEALHGLA